MAGGGGVKVLWESWWVVALLFETGEAEGKLGLPIYLFYFPAFPSLNPIEWYIPAGS